MQEVLIQNLHEPLEAVYLKIRLQTPPFWIFFSNHASHP